MYLFIQSLETVDNSEHSCVKFSLGNATDDTFSTTRGDRIPSLTMLELVSIGKITLKADIQMKVSR